MDKKIHILKQTGEELDEILSLKPDSVMSGESENAVQNKVVKNYVDQRAQQAYNKALEYTKEEISALGNSLRGYTDNKVESVSPLYVNIGMDFPNETATGTLPDLEISFSDILSAAEGKRDIWIVVSDGTAYQCLVTYLSENSGGIAIRAYKHEVNEANFSTIAIAFFDGSVPVWHSNYIEFQEKLVSGENLATVNGKSLLQGGNIVVEGGGGGASIPVVSSEEELESLSQNKGDLAVILSDDEIKSGNVRCLDLPTISMATVQQFDFSECASVQGIAINTEVDVPPCPSFAGQNIQFIVAPRKMGNPLEASFLGFDLSEPFDDDGYCRGTLQVTMVQGGNDSSALPLAQYDNATGKMVLVDSEAIAELNSLVIGAMIEDPVFVSYSEMVQAGGEGLKDTLAFFECISSVAKFGTKSIRVKDDEGYSRLDSDIIKVADKKAISSLNSLDMPIGSLVRVHYPEETKYDTDIATMHCCITEPEFDSSKATVLNKVEFTRACTTEELEEDAGNLPPYLVLTDRNGSQFCEVVFEMGGDGNIPLAVKFSMDEGKTYSHLLQDGVWNEELIEEFNSIVSGGVNILYKLGKAGNSLWNPQTGVCVYLEQDGSLDEETLSQIAAILEMMIGAYVQFRYNERHIPERIEEYDRVTKGWVKKNELANVTFKTINGEEVIGEGDISIEGGTEEIYIGDTQPTDENIKIWIDTSVEGVEKYRDANGKWVATSGSGGGASAWDNISGKPSFAKVATSGSYNDLNDKPSVNDATLTIQRNGVDVGTFSSNASSNVKVNIQVPTKVSEMTDSLRYVTSVNNLYPDSSGNVDLSAGGFTIDAALSTTSENAIQNKAVTEALNKKQPRLVSGSNIKTINGESILGSGDIVIGGGNDGVNVVLFDATCAQYPYNLPELTTTTDVQSITDAIALNQPIYIQFAAALCPATEASLVNGSPHLFLHLADAEDGIARMIHIYAYDVVWTWETFEMELGGASGDYVRSVNGVTPDDNGNVQIEVNIDGEVVDTTLSSLVGSGSTFTLEELVG